MYYPEDVGHEDLVIKAITHKIPDDCHCVITSDVEVESSNETMTRYFAFDKVQAAVVYDDIVNIKDIILHDIQVYANPQIPGNNEYEEPSPAGLSTLCARLEINRNIKINSDIDISSLLRKLPFVKKLPPSLITRPDPLILDLFWCLDELISVKSESFSIHRLLKDFAYNVRFMNGKYSILPMEALSYTIALPTWVFKFNGRELKPVYIYEMYDGDYNPKVRYYRVAELLDSLDTIDNIN